VGDTAPSIDQDADLAPNFPAQFRELPGKFVAEQDVRV
jgi:hypothetical protein